MDEYNIITIAIDNGYDFEFLEPYHIHLIINRITEDKRSKAINSEVSIEYPIGNKLITSAALNLTSYQDRARFVTTLTKAYFTKDYIPWDIVIEKACAESILRFRHDHETDLVTGPQIKTLSEVEVEVIKWLWYPYIPYGKLTLLEGDPGVGKSWLTLAIVTALSLGRGLPNQSELAYGSTLVVSAEDGLSDTIKPRLLSMGADTNIIHAVDGLFTLDEDGFLMLENHIAEKLPCLLVVDPLVAYLSGDMDINKANQARYATARLAHLANKWGLAVIAVRHLTKGRGDNSKAIYRGLGSIDYTAAARSVLLAGDDPDRNNSRGFVHIKANLAVLGQPIGYEITDGQFYWLDHCELTPDKILRASKETDISQVDIAKDFLLSYLDKEPYPAKDIFADAKEQDISERTLNRAKKELNIRTFRDGTSGKKGGGKWLWELPKNDD